jgi:tripartite ATP-independent transporter DctP family solute receptor
MISSEGGGIMFQRHFNIVVIIATIGMLFLVNLNASGAEKEWDKAPWISGKMMTLKAGYNTVKQYPHGRAIERFCNRIEERTGQYVTMNTFPSESAGSEKEMLEAVMMGTLDMCKTSTAVVTGFVPEFGVFDMPYIFRDYNHLMKVVSGPVGKQLLDKLESKGVIGLFWMEQGTRNIYTARKAVRSPQDLKGLKIRSMQSPIMVETINLMGGTATPMAFGELYTALKQGVVDGAENAPDALWYSKQYEVTKFFSLTNHFMTPVLFMMNAKIFNSLPKDYQEIIKLSAKEAEEWSGSLYSEVAKGLLGELEKNGVEVIKVDETPFREAVKPIYEKYGKEFGDLIKQIQEIK